MPELQRTLAVGVDPGLSTGLASILDGTRFVVAQFNVKAVGGMDAFESEFVSLCDYARAQNLRLLVACERFVVNRQTARMSQQNDALRVQGRVESLSPVPVELQSVASATAFASNARLRQLHLYTRPAEVDAPDADDANSAMRHALLVLARKAARHYERLVYDATSS